MGSADQVVSFFPALLDEVYLCTRALISSCLSFARTRFSMAPVWYFGSRQQSTSSACHFLDFRSNPMIRRGQRKYLWRETTPSSFVSSRERTSRGSMFSYLPHLC